MISKTMRNAMVGGLSIFAAVGVLWAGWQIWQASPPLHQQITHERKRALPQTSLLNPRADALDSWIEEKKQRAVARFNAPTKDEDSDQGERALDRMDQPGEALEFFLQKRLPAGERALASARYLDIMEKAATMPLFTSSKRRFIRPQELLQSKLNLLSLPTWTPLGPGNVGGRTRGLLIHPAQPNTMYAAGVAGGVWKTTNGGGSWTPLTDLLANIAVNALAMDPSNPNVIYAGTGEGFNNLDSVRGAGIFKTTDGGTSWTWLSNTANNLDFYYVNDLVVSALNPQRVYAATSTGVFRSLDGGNSWVAAHQPTVNASATPLGCHDLALRASGVTSDYLLAACGNFTQATIFLKQDAETAGAWSAVKTESGMGRTSLAIAPSSQNVVYALSTELFNFPGFQYKHALHAVFRSTDGGLTWTTQRNANGTPNLNTLIMSYLSDNCVSGKTERNGQGWYDNVIAVDPVDPNRVWVGGIDLFRSDDGGVNWGFGGNSVHPDQHAIVFHPDYDGVANQTMFVGNDGGVYKTVNARAALGTNTPVPGNCTTGTSAVSWTNLNFGYEVTQFYHGLPYPNGLTYLGGTQDNGTVRGTDGAGRNGWSQIRGGDGGYVAIDPNNTNVLYSETTQLSFAKTTNGNAALPTWAPAIAGITEPSDHFLFITPFAMDPNNAQRLWIGGRALWRTTNGATSWQQASVSDQVFPGSVSAIAIAPTDSNIVFAGSSTGGVYRTMTALSNTAGATWLNSSPRAGYVSSLAIDPRNASIVYVTYSTFGGNHIWKSTDGGTSWNSIDGIGTSGIPDVPVHAIAIHPSDSNRLYLGTDIGVFVTLDGGATWARENTGFANVITESLTILGDGCNAVVYAFTHGRGVWKVAAADCGGCPTLSGMNATTGAVGSSVTFTGTNLTGVTVQFANNALATITANTGEQLTVTVPSGAMTGPITLSKKGCLDIQTASFTVPGTPACPSVSALNPASGSPGATLTLSGTDFIGVTALQFSNNVNAFFTINSNAQITATVPGGAVTGPITLMKPGCANFVTTTSFTLTAPACATIAGISPASGEVGSEVIINGTNLSNISDVRFGNYSAQFFIKSNSEIAAFVPSGAVTGPITLLMANCSNAQTASFTITAGGGWTETNGPQGGYLNSLLHTSGFLFATTLNGGVYRSTDNGASWTRASTGLPSGAQTYSLGTNNEALFVGTSYGLYRSTNNGATWGEANNGLTYVENNASYLQGVSGMAAIGTAMFIGTFEKGVYRSTDNGGNWTQISNGMGNQRVLSLIAKDGTLFAGTSQNGIFRSTDNGANWTAVNNGLGTPWAVYSLLAHGTYLFAGTHAQGVYRSSDNGNNWQPINAGLNLQVQSIRSLTVNGTTLLAGTERDGVYRSTDNGTTWLSANNGLGNFPALALAVSGSQVMAGTARGAFRSADNGLSWQATNTGLKAPEISDLETVNSTLLAATFGDGIYRSGDNGSSWMPSNTGLSDFNIYDIGVNGTTLFVSTNDGVYRSLDQGATWVLANTGLENKIIKVFAVSGSNIFAGTLLDGGVYKSSDNGGLWVPVSNGIANQSILSLAVNGAAVFAGTKNGGIFRTTDNGANWVSVNTGISLPFAWVSGLMGNGTTLFAAVSGRGLYRSTDNGESWTAVNSGLGCLFPTSFAAQGSTIYAATNGGGVYRSINNGTTWSSYSGGLASTLVTKLVTQGNNLFASIDGRAVHLFQNFAMTGCPTISNLNPINGSTGQTVTISGGNLTGVTAVKFNNNVGASFQIINDAQIIATVPPGAVTGPLTLSKVGCGDVTTPVYISTACPAISGLSPTSGLSGSTVTINGTDFTGVTAVKFRDNLSASFTVVSDTQLTATVPTGAVSGTITLLKPGCAATASPVFTVPGSFACPVINSLNTPIGVIGGTVVITGADLTWVSSVTFSNNLTANFTINSNTQLTATIPANAVSGPITLYTANCAGVPSPHFSITGCPTVDSILPNSGVVGSKVKIIGDNLQGVSSVKFNNNALSAAFSLTRFDTIEVIVPPGASTGSLTLAMSGCPNAQTPVFTVNSGGAWAPTGGPTGSLIWSMHIAGGQLFAGTSDKIYRSADEGANWTLAGNGLGEGPVLAITSKGSQLFAGSLYFGIYRSSDQGQSWTNVSAGLGGSQGSQAVRALAANENYLFAGMNSHGVFRSADEGANWTAANSGIGNQTVQALFSNSARLFAGTEANGAYRSLDNGNTWTPMVAIPTSSGVYDFAANGTALFAATTSGIYRSLDNGDNWSQVLNGGYSSIEISEGSIFAGNVSSADIRRSSDNGASWVAVNNGIGSAFVRNLTANTNHVFVGSTAGVFRSANNGDNWVSTNKGIIAQPIRALTTIGATLFAATSGNGIYRSANGGVDWTAANNGLSSSAFWDLIANGSDLFVGTSDGVFRSSDNGDNWVAINNGFVSFSKTTYTLAANGTTLLAGQAFQGVYVSTNNGLNWTAVNNGIGLQTVNAVAISGTTFFAGVGDGPGGVTIGVYRSTDGGANWSLVLPGVSPNSITISGAAILAATNLGVYRSTDNGITWTNIHALGSQKVVTSNATLFSATALGVYRSTDNGVTWTSFNVGLTNLNTQSLLILGDRLFAGTEGSSVFVRFNLLDCPTITDIAPVNVTVGHTLTLTGTNLSGITSVKFNNNVTATITGNTATQLTVKVPAGALTGPVLISKSGCDDYATASVNICAYTLATSQQLIGAGGGTGSFSFTASNANCSWTAAATAPWLSVTTGASGTGNGVVSYAVAANPEQNDRSGAITVGGQVFTIFQVGLRNAAILLSVGNLGSAEAAPDSIVMVFANELTHTIQGAAGLPLPTTLGGVTVSVKDSANLTRNAEIFFVTPSQLNFVVPNGTANGLAIITVNNASGASLIGTIQIATVAPSLFSAESSGAGVMRGYAIRNGASVEPVARFNQATLRWEAVPVSLSGGPLELVLQGTGFRHRSSLAAVNVTINGVPATVVSAGASAVTVGFDELRVQVPTLAGSATPYNISVTIDGKPANVVQVRFQ